MNKVVAQLPNDIWSRILIGCDIKDVVKLISINKNLRTIVNNDYFWNVKFNNDYEDVHKVDDETWKQYYKRRYKNYGTPILLQSVDLTRQTPISPIIKADGINCIEFSLSPQQLITNCVKFFHSMNPDIYVILTKDHNVFLVIEEEVYEINGSYKDIHVTADRFYFMLDINNNLYVVDYNEEISLDPLLLSENVVNIFNHKFDGYVMYYQTDTKTVKWTFDDHNIQQQINCDPHHSYYFNFDDILKSAISIDGKLMTIIGGVGHGFEDCKFEEIVSLSDKKFIDASYDETNRLLALCEDGFVYIVDDSLNFTKINIPYVTSLKCNSFLTQNGDLYYVDDMHTKLLDTNVTYVDQISHYGIYDHNYSAYIRK